LNKYLKIAFKAVAWLMGVVVGLLLLVFILLEIPAVQNLVKNKVVTYLENKIKTPVKVEKIQLRLPKKIVLKGVYFESQEKDTLLAGEKLAVDVSLFKLLDNKLEINSIDLQGITANVKRGKDSVFNFDYIVNAFASEQEKEPKPEDTTSTMKFSVEKINLDKIRVRFDDAITKNNLDVYLGHFDTNIKTFDLDSMNFNIPKITLSGLNLQLKQGIVEELVKNAEEAAEEIANTPALKLKLGEIDLAEIVIGYDNEESKLKTELSLGKLLVKLKDIDLEKQIVKIDKIDFRDTKGNLALGKFEKKVISENEIVVEDTVGAKGWQVHLSEADFANINFKFDDNNATPVKRGLDYMHLDLQNLNLKAEDFYYSTDTISGNILELTAKDKSGLNIESLKTDFFYGPKSAYLKKLYIKTPHTLIKDELKVNYPSIASLSDKIGELGMDASIKGSKIAFRDILLFAPNLANTNPFKSNPNAVMQINSRISGKVKDLRIPNLEISGIGTTKISASGRMTGLPDVERANFDLNIKNFQSSAKDIYGFVPPRTIPNSIQLPSYINLKGVFKGGINKFFTDLNLISSFGGAKVKANFDQRIKNKERYQAYIEANNLDVGKFIKNDSIGKITLKLRAEGKGLDPKTADAKVVGIVNSAVYNHYNYKNLKLNGNIKSGLFDAKANMQDPNLDFNLAANGSFKDKYPTVKMKLVLDSADFNKLNLYSGSLRMRLNLDADIKTADPDYLNGLVSVNTILIAQGEERFTLDSINVYAISTDTNNVIRVKSPFINGRINGKYKLTEVGTALSNSIAKYYNSNPGQEFKKTSPQYFDFTFRLENHPVLKQFASAIKRLDPITISGRYNSEQDSISINGNIPNVVYGGNTINNGVLKVNTTDSTLNYSLFIDEIKSGSIALPKTSLTGKAANNILDYMLQVRDKGDKQRYQIAGNLKSVDKNTEIRLDPQNFMLNYEKWTVAQDNLIRIGEAGIWARDFTLSNSGQSIKIESQSEAANSPLAVDFSQFKIETLTSIVEQDSMKIGGTLDGNVLLDNLNESMVFTSDLNVKNLNFQKDTVGDIAIKVDNKQADRFAADIAITGQGNQVNLTGFYLTSAESLDMNLDIQKLNLKSVQGFTFGNMTDARGYLSGDFNISGKTSAPKVIGDLKFNDGAFRITTTNSYFQSLNDKISFNQEGIAFNKFRLTDSTNNSLVVNGSLLTQTYTDFKFNLDVNANNFKVVGSTAKDNDLFYGNLYINTRMRIRGDMNNPVIDGNLKINEDTEFTLVLPTSDPGIVQREGIVEFIDQDFMAFQDVFSEIDSIKEESNTTFTGMDVSVDISVDKGAVLTMIIDKGNGDFVEVKGEAELNGGIDPSGKINLTGNYELQEGSYEMTFNFLNRKFDIQKGSTITWTGEPMSANLDITAVYVANTAPIDLLEDQLVDVSANVRNTYKQKLPFEVLLQMKGELLKPEITFDIRLPEGNYNVATEIVDNSETKLAQLRQQPSELNKQVFALLLLNRFIGENPFASQAGGGGVETMVRQSVSKILSEQLNNLAGNLIEGVELNFDLESTEDYSTGSMENRTDLNVGLSKRFLDDRLKVTVGSNFGLEGNQQPNRETNNIAGDLAVDYQLSKDGRYMLRAYRKNEYQVALQGQVIETGVGFILTMDYNKFREIFESRKSRRERRSALRRRETQE